MKALILLSMVLACSCTKKDNLGLDEGIAKDPTRLAKSMVLDPVTDWKLMFTPSPDRVHSDKIKSKLEKWGKVSSPEEAMQKARLESAIGSYSASEDTLKSAVRSYPNDLDLKLELALVYSRKGNAESSLALLTEIRVLLDEITYPDKVFLFKYRYCLGLAYLDNKDVPKGQDIMSQLVGIDSTFAPAYVALALSYLNSGKISTADFVAKRGLERSGENLALLNLIGTIARTNGKLDEALEWYAKAININSKFIPALVNRAAIGIEKGDAESAEKDLQIALKLDSEQVDALNLQGVLWIQKKNYERARNVLTRVIEIDPNNVDARFNLALTLESSAGENAELKRLYQEILQLAPPSSAVYGKADQRLSEMRPF